VIFVAWDVVVVGGGVAGLSCGAILAKRGLRVLLLEAGSELGGRARSLPYKPGYTVDWGIHALRAGDAGVAANLLNRLGTPLEVAQLGEGRLYHAGSWQPLPTSVQALMSTELLTREEREAVGSLFAAILGAKPHELLETSVDSWLSSQGASSGIRFIFQLYAGLILIVPDLASASMGELLDIMHTILRTGKAAGYPKGGWKVIIERLRGHVEENGEIRTNTRVKSLLIRNGAVEGVQTAEGSIPCERVVAALPPEDLAPLLPSQERGCKQLVRQATSIRPTAGVSIDLGLSSPVTDAPGLIVSTDPFVLGQATSNIDPSVAPPGKQLLTFYYPLPPKEVKNRRQAEAALDSLIQLIRRMFPRVKDKVEWERRLILPVVDGAAPTITQHRRRRLPLQTPVKGLYLAGDAHQAPGAGADIAFNAARLCAAKILGEG